MTIDLPPDLESAMASEAQRRGITPQALVLLDLQQRYQNSAFEKDPSDTSASAEATPITPEERHQRVQRFLAKTRTLPRDVPHLSDEEISREAIYARDTDADYQPPNYRPSQRRSEDTPQKEDARRDEAA